MVISKLIAVCLLCQTGLFLPPSAAQAAVDTAYVAENGPWQESYELSVQDGTPIIRQVNIGGQLVDAAIDTGCGEMLLPLSVFSRLQSESVENLPALDYSGASADYPSGFIRTRRLGAARETYESAVGIPDDRIGGAAILPLNHLQADLICFICSEGQLILCDNDAEWGDIGIAESQVGGEMHYIPYWENLGGIFLGVEIEGQRCLALR